MGCQVWHNKPPGAIHSRTSVQRREQRCFGGRDRMRGPHTTSPPPLRHSFSPFPPGPGARARAYAGAARARERTRHMRRNIFVWRNPTAKVLWDYNVLPGKTTRQDILLALAATIVSKQIPQPIFTVHTHTFTFSISKTKTSSPHTQKQLPDKNASPS